MYSIISKQFKNMLGSFPVEKGKIFSWFFLKQNDKELKITENQNQREKPFSTDTHISREYLNYFTL